MALVAAGMLVGGLLLTVMGADVYRQGVTVVGPNATTTNATAIVFTGSGVSTNTSSGGTNTVTISGGGSITIINDASLAAGTIVGTSPGTAFGIGNLASATFSPTWVDIARPAQWMTPSGIGNTSTNIIAPIWVYSRTAGGSVQALGYTSSSNALHDVSFATEFTMPFGATAWGSANAFDIPVWSSSTSASTNKMDLRITSPDGTQTNITGLVSTSAGAFTHVLVSTNYLPWVAASSNTIWQIDGYMYAGWGRTNAVGTIKAHVR
jgi:hypothetical protein